jgi:hypothetical protein
MRTQSKFYCSYLEASDFSTAHGFFEQFAICHRLTQQLLNVESISPITKYSKRDGYLLMDVELGSTREFANMFFELFWTKFFYYLVDQVDECKICMRFNWKGSKSNE